MNEADCVKCSWYVNYVCNCPYDSCSFEEYRPFTYTKEELEQLKHNIYNEAIDGFVSMLTTKEIAQTYDFDDVLCNGNYDANFNDFRNYVREIAEQLKEKKNG